MLRHYVALASGLVGAACAVGFAAAVLSDGDVGLRILLFLPISALAMLVGDRKTHYETPRAWLLGFAATNALLAALGVYLMWLERTLEGLSRVPALGFAFVCFLGVSMLTPLLLLRGVRERRRGPAATPAINFQSSRGPA